MSTSLFLLAAVLVLIFSFTTTNGFLDGGGIVSTVITTRTMEPLPALIMVACCEVLGVSLLGNAVVRTIGLSMIRFPGTATPREILLVLFSAVAAALFWNSMMWRLSWPTSSSHALLGGLLGAIGAHFGQTAISWHIVLKIVAGLALVPLMAALISLVMALVCYWVGQFLTTAVLGPLRAVYIVVLAGVALVHGSNDGQKSMALVLLALLAFGRGSPAAHVPVWVGLACGLALGLGVVFGSRRTIQTVGRRFYKIQNLQGLSAESTAMLLVGASSLFGLPMSTSQVMSSSVIGAGAAVHPRSVRWDLAGELSLVWLATIPAAAIVAALLSYVVSKTF